MSALPDLMACSTIVGRRTVEIDARDCSLRAFEDDVFGFLHVQVAGAQMVEHVGQHAGTVPVADDKHVAGRRPRAEVDDVGDLAGLLVGRG